MDSSEYAQWARYHASLFPSWGDNRRSLLNAKEVSDHMQKTLEDFKYDDCVQASNDMYEGRIEKPIAYDDHILTIKNRARDIRFARENTRPKYVDNQPTYRCCLCQDKGYLSRWSPETVQAAQRGVYDDYISYWMDWHANEFVRPDRREPVIDRSHRPKTQAIRCSCIAGEMKQNIASYNESLDVLNEGELLCKELHKCKLFEIGNADLSSAIADFNSDF